MEVRILTSESSDKYFLKRRFHLREMNTWGRAGARIWEK
jgi:hypothetical protein